MMTLESWIGYLEHSTPERLNEYTANAGKGGCTVFAAKLWHRDHRNLMGLPWCTTFIHAVVDRPDILGKAHPGVRVLARRMRFRRLWRNTDYRPERGDLIFLDGDLDGKIDHCGIVATAEGEIVSSIEGNTVDPTGHFPPIQGGAVARRDRKLSDDCIAGYAAIGAKLERT